jgi:hypothetical protein
MSFLCYFLEWALERPAIQNHQQKKRKPGISTALGQTPGKEQPNRNLVGGPNLTSTKREQEAVTPSAIASQSPGGLTNLCFTRGWGWMHLI